MLLDFLIYVFQKYLEKKFLQGGRKYKVVFKIVLIQVIERENVNKNFMFIKFKIMIFKDI